MAGGSDEASWDPVFGHDRRPPPDAADAASERQERLENLRLGHLWPPPQVIVIPSDGTRRQAEGDAPSVWELAGVQPASIFRVYYGRDV